MKLITLLAFTIIAFSAKAGTKHELNFKETVTLKKVRMTTTLPKNLEGLFIKQQVKLANL